MVLIRYLSTNTTYKALFFSSNITNIFTAAITIVRSFDSMHARHHFRDSRSYSYIRNENGIVNVKLITVKQRKKDQIEQNGQSVLLVKQRAIIKHSKYIL